MLKEQSLDGGSLQGLMDKPTVLKAHWLQQRVKEEEQLGPLDQHGGRN